MSSTLHGVRLAVAMFAIFAWSVVGCAPQSGSESAYDAHLGGQWAPPPDTGSVVCDPGVRDDFCHWLGVCNTAGTGCVCDDAEHYSADDMCGSWQQAVVPPGGVCLDGDRSYCHFVGTCADDVCVCDDGEHYDADERCSTWHPAVVPSGDACLAGDRSYCHHHGTCLPDGSGCACDDPTRYRADEQCSTSHDVVLPTDGFCVPLDRNTCGGNGTCAADGETCVCDTDWWRGPRCDVSLDSCPGYGLQADFTWVQEACSGQGDCMSGSVCDCLAGYEGDDCSVEIDECAEALDDCDVNATCTNTPGSFECECDPGFHGDGTSCASDVPQEADLVAHLRFGGDLLDATGNGHHGFAAVDTSFVADRYGNAGSAVRLGPSLSSFLVPKNNIDLDLPELTVSMWMRPEDFTSTTSDAVCMVASQQQVGFIGQNRRGYQVCLRLSTQKVAFNSFQSFQSKEALSPAMAFEFDEWAMVTATRSGFYIKVFVNGEQVGIDTFFGHVNPILTTMTVGLGSTPPNQYSYTGALDDLMVWQVGLTDAEVAELYLAQRP